MIEGVISSCRVSIVMPVYNEVRTIEYAVRRLRAVFADLNLTDMETCYKMARTGLLKSLPLKTNRFDIEPELTALFSQAQARIYEVPISYNGRTYAEGKKIGWKDGVAAFWHIFRANVLDRKAPLYDRALEAGHGEHAGAHARVSTVGEGRDAGVPPGIEAAGERRAADVRRVNDESADRSASRPAGVDGGRARSCGYS